MNALENKVALVTGGSKGIGLAVADAIVRAGMNVAITARNRAEVEAAAARLEETGPGKSVGIVCDVRDFEQQRSAVDRVVAAYGGLDVVIANAGVGRFAAVDEMSVEDWHSVIDTNLTGVFYTVKASVAQLKKRKGYLITIGSLAGTNFFAGGSAYNASKFGLAGFSQAAMLDLRRHGVKVSTIMPGSVATHFSGSAPAPSESWKIQPEDIGEMVMYLLTAPERTLPSKIEVRPSRPPSS
ncbi:MAG: SDR family oxidoreductase [Trueperaceae bacterium]